MNANLERLILQIETRLAAIEQAYPKLDHWDDGKWRARQQAYRAIIDDLVSIDCAKFREGDAYMLTLAGIRTSCTGGDHGLLTGWVRRARAQVEASKAGATAAPGKAVA